MFSIVEVAFTLSIAAYLVLLVAIVVFYLNYIKEQREIGKLKIRWIALKKHS